MEKKPTKNADNDPEAIGWGHADADGFYKFPDIPAMAKAAGISEKQFRRTLMKAAEEGWMIIRGDRFCPAIPRHLSHLIDEDGNYVPGTADERGPH